jgi:hypothetical protein
MKSKLNVCGPKVSVVIVNWNNAGPRKCKKEAMSYRPFEMILGALPIVPLKVFEEFGDGY